MGAPSVTHSSSMGARHHPLAFTVVSGSILSVTAPRTPLDAPPCECCQLLRFDSCTNTRHRPLWQHDTHVNSSLCACCLLPHNTNVFRPCCLSMLYLVLYALPCLPACCSAPQLLLPALTFHLLHHASRLLPALPGGSR
jgi:hypothetical protein